MKFWYVEHVDYVLKTSLAGQHIREKISTIFYLYEVPRVGSHRTRV